MYRLTALTLLALVPAAAQPACGDCDGSGALSVLDALEAARHGAGLTTIPPPRFFACDVDSGGSVDILDALRLAQAAAGLSVPLTCPVVNQAPVLLLEYHPPLDRVLVPLYCTLTDQESDPVDVLLEHSTDGGISWRPLTPQAGISITSATTGLATSPAGVPLVLVWDSWTDLPHQTLAVDLRGWADDGQPGPTATSTVLLENGAAPSTYEAECIPLAHRWPAGATVSFLAGARCLQVAGTTLTFGTSCQSHYELDGGAYQSALSTFCLQVITTLSVAPGQMAEWPRTHDPGAYLLSPGVHDLTVVIPTMPTGQRSIPIDLQIW